MSRNEAFALFSLFWFVGFIVSGCILDIVRSSYYDNRNAYGVDKKMTILLTRSSKFCFVGCGVVAIIAMVYAMGATLIHLVGKF